VELTAYIRPASCNKGDLVLREGRAAGRGREKREAKEGGRESEWREGIGGDPRVYL